MSRTVKLFTTKSCVKCNGVKRWLDIRGIAYEVIDVTDKPDLADAIRALAADRSEPCVMPLVEVHKGLGDPPVQWFDFRPDLLAEHLVAV